MTFKEEICADIDWRMSEIATLKAMPVQYNISGYHRQTYIKYLIPSFYSLWEGYVKNSFQIYAVELNSLNIPIADVNINLLTHALTSTDKLSLENSRLKFNTKIEFVQCYQQQISNPLRLGMSLPTKSNINFEVINDILNRFHLKLLPDFYSHGLDKLLTFRNKIAHGDNSIPVKDEHITEFSSLVTDLMIEVYDIIEEGYDSRSYQV